MLGPGGPARSGREDARQVVDQGGQIGRLVAAGVLEVGVDDVQSALDQPSQVGKVRSRPAGTRCAWPGSPRATGCRCRRGRGWSECGRGLPGGLASRPIVLLRPGPRAAPTSGGVAVDGPTDQRGAGHGAEVPAVGAGVPGVARPPRACRPGGRCAVTLLTRMRPGSLGSRTATTAPGWGQGWRQPGQPEHHQPVPGQEGGGHGRAGHLDPRPARQRTQNHAWPAGQGGRGGAQSAPRC